MERRWPSPFFFYPLPSNVLFLELILIDILIAFFFLNISIITLVPYADKGLRHLNSFSNVYALTLVTAIYGA